MSGEENIKDFMDFINNISPIDNKTEKVENNNIEKKEIVTNEKNESKETPDSKTDNNLEKKEVSSKNKKKEGKFLESKNNNTSEKKEELPSFQKTKEEVEDILKNIIEIKEFFKELKLNSKRDIESYTDEILSGASQQSKVLFDLMEKVLTSWQDYHAEILNKSNIKDLVINNEKKKSNFIFLYIISFINIFLIIFLIFINLRAK